ncbi:Hypothetical predicted protein, partial [Paramuricea clavata]
MNVQVLQELNTTATWLEQRHYCLVLERSRETEVKIGRLYWRAFVFDEMKIQEDLQMKTSDGNYQLVGMIELGQFHNNVKQIDTGSQAAQIATHILQFIFLSDCGF